MIRLSSFGDVVLSTSAIGALKRRGYTVDFLTGSEFVGLLQGHPDLNQVMGFDRSKSMSEWVSTLRKCLRDTAYDEVVDLHASLRTRLAIPLLRSEFPNVAWSQVSKERIRRLLFLIFKAAWPRSLRPRSWVYRFAKSAGGKGDERPCLPHLRESQSGEPRVGVAPGSLWSGKCWPLEKFLELSLGLVQSGLRPVVLGASDDARARELAGQLRSRGVAFIDAVGNRTLPELGRLLSTCQQVYTNDSGPAHLAESVGVPAHILFGPTHPDLGFAPWGPESRVSLKGLGCQPCSRDGSVCYRFWDRYGCLKRLASKEGRAFEYAPRASLRMNFYRWLARRLFGSWQVGVVFPTSKARRVWIHGASAGELEMLWTVAERMSRASWEIIVTGFSPSAHKSLERLKAELGSRVVYAGPSPRDGAWGEAIARLKPEVFISAKYEAWPELWGALSEAAIPVTLVGAKLRPSLKVVKAVLSLLGTKLPVMDFLLADEGDSQALAEAFPSARIQWTGDPRWDRMNERSKSRSSSARDVIEKLQSLPRPWGVFGSVWLEDWQAVGSAFEAFKGTLFLVPHEVSSKYIEQFKAGLRPHIPSFQVSTGQVSTGAWAERSASSFQSVLVDQVGYLAELYAFADFAIVGGGFKKSGLHSVIEPAFFGLPIAGGPAKSERFPEVARLSRTGQFSLVKTSDDLRRWLETLVDRSKRGDTSLAVELGATERVFTVVKERIS